MSETIKELMSWEAACEALGLDWDERTAANLWDADGTCASFDLLFELTSDVVYQEDDELRLIMRREVLGDFLAAHIKKAIDQEIPCFFFDDKTFGITTINEMLSDLVLRERVILIRGVRVEISDLIPQYEKWIGNEAFLVSSVIFAGKSKVFAVAYNIGRRSNGRELYGDH